MLETMSIEGQLVELLQGFPSTQKICNAVLDLRPDHLRFLLKGMRACSPELMETTERLATAILSLCSPDLRQVAKNYLWTCDLVNEEQLYFQRNGRYRLSTFEQAYAEVYSKADLMEKYMSGLLLSQVMWINHAASMDFFLRVAKELLPANAKYLEIGPGHGLMLYLSLRDLPIQAATAWDLSEVSISQTQSALRKLGVTECQFAVHNILEESLTDINETFDIIVLSEILEHLENPRHALERMKKVLKPGGHIFVNMPINSPAPDHLYLLNNDTDAIQLLESAGLEVVRSGFFTTQGMDLSKAIRNRVSVSACMFARER